jgi:hypothetical protein
MRSGSDHRVHVPRTPTERRADAFMALLLRVSEALELRL